LFFGAIAGWIYFAIGLIVSYEVVMRYFFNSPTDWVEEISRIGMVWGTFLLFAACIAERQLITITLVKANLSERGKMWLELFNFTLMALISAMLLWYAIVQLEDSIRIGRATATPLRVPYWIFYLPLVIGFGLMLLQALAEMAYILINRKRRKPDVEHEH